MKTVFLASVAAATLIAAPAFAQDAASEPTAPPAKDASATAATLAVGATVKDKTGASIGTVTEVKPDAAGQQVATIKMGADTFAVETSKLAIADGSATINATAAELQAMLKK